MTDPWGVAYLLAPLLGGGVFHALCMKHDWLAFLRRPIDGGTLVGGKPLFGANKTFRGPVAVGIGAALVLGVQASLLHRMPSLRSIELFDYGAVNGWLLGFVVGSVAMLAELPNSFLKRRLDVAPGEPGRGIAGALLYVLDQVDLLLGAWLVLAWFVDVRASWVIFSIVLVLVVHQALTWVTYALGMRRSPR
jgi:hypothetical protein